MPEIKERRGRGDIARRMTGSGIDASRYVEFETSAPDLPEHDRG